MSTLRLRAVHVLLQVVEAAAPRESRNSLKGCLLQDFVKHGVSIDALSGMVPNFEERRKSRTPVSLGVLVASGQVRRAWAEITLAF